MVTKYGIQAIYKCTEYSSETHIDILVPSQTRNSIDLFSDNTQTATT